MVLVPAPRKKGRGGYRAPSQPAATSGPGALSQRTDGRASEAAARGIVNDTPSTGYGDKAALQQAQSMIPAGRAAPAGPSVQDPFAPTARPGEPVTAGAAVGAGPGPANLLADDPTVVLRGLLAAYPHPDIVKLAAFYGIT